MTRKIEEFIPPIKEDGFATDKAAALGSTLAVTGAATFASTLAVTGATTLTGSITPTGGVAAAAGFTVPTVYHTGQLQPTSATTTVSGATNASVVTTESYVCEVFVPANCTLTGVSVMNGTAVAGNLTVGLANSSGTIVASSTTGTAASGTTAYQQIPFSATYAAKGPAKYFIVLQGSNTSGRYVAHTIGNFGAAKVTGETYGTLLTTAAYSTTTFTTAIAPVASTY